MVGPARGGASRPADEVRKASPEVVRDETLAGRRPSRFAASRTRVRRASRPLGSARALRLAAPNLHGRAASLGAGRGRIQGLRSSPTSAPRARLPRAQIVDPRGAAAAGGVAERERRAGMRALAGQHQHQRSAMRLAGKDRSERDGIVDTVSITSPSASVRRTGDEVGRVSSVFSRRLATSSSGVTRASTTPARARRGPRGCAHHGPSMSSRASRGPVGRPR